MQQKKRYYQTNKRRYARKKKSILRNRFFWYFILLVIAGAGIFYFLVFSPIFQLKNVTIKGASFINASEIEDIINKQAEKNILFLTTRSIIAFNSKEIEALILEKFLPAEEVAIKRRFFNKLIVNILERQARAVFCYSDECFLLDQEGLAFQPTEREIDFPNKAVIVSDESGELGRIAVSKEDLIFINDIFGLLKQRNILIKEFRAFPSKIEAIISESGLLVYFNPQKDPELQVQDLILVLDSQNSPDLEGRRAQEYIDLRFDKIFLK